MLGEAHHAGTVAIAFRLMIQFGQGSDHAAFFTLHQGHLPVRRVMLVAHAGGERGFTLLQGAQHAACHIHLAQHRFQHGAGDSAWAQDAGRAVADIQHGGFQPDIAAAAVQNQRNAAVHVLQHMPSGGGAGLAGAVGAGSGDGQIARLQHGRCHRMGGHAYRHGGQPRRDLRRHSFLLFHQDGQRPGPEGVHQPPGDRGDLA